MEVRERIVKREGEGGAKKKKSERRVDRIRRI